MALYNLRRPNLQHSCRPWRVISVCDDSMPNYHDLHAYSCGRKPMLLRRIFILITTLIITANVLVTMIFTLSSLWNYPGGEAMTLFHQKYPPSYKRTALSHYRFSTDIIPAISNTAHPYLQSGRPNWRFPFPPSQLSSLPTITSYVQATLT